MPIIKYNPDKPLFDVPIWFVEKLDEDYCDFKNKSFYKKYLKIVNYNFKREVLTRFPLLKIYHRDMKPSYIIGFNVLKETIDDINPPENEYYKYGMYMLAYIPNYNAKMKRQEAALIYDVWGFIDYKTLVSSNKAICHLDNVKNYQFNHICTNKAVEINNTNFIYTPISVARTLYVEYRHVDQGGEFRLECHEHGGDY